MSSSTQVSTTSGPAALQTTSGDPLLTAGSANMISPSVNSATRRRLRTRNGRRLVETMSVPAAACQMAYNLGRASGDYGGNTAVDTGDGRTTMFTGYAVGETNMTSVNARRLAHCMTPTPEPSPSPMPHARSLGHEPAPSPSPAVDYSDCAVDPNELTGTVVDLQGGNPANPTAPPMNFAVQANENFTEDCSVYEDHHARNLRAPTADEVNTWRRRRLEEVASDATSDFVEVTGCIVYHCFEGDYKCPNPSGHEHCLRWGDEEGKCLEPACMLLDEDILEKAERRRLQGAMCFGALLGDTGSGDPMGTPVPMPMGGRMLGHVDPSPSPLPPGCAPECIWDFDCTGPQGVPGTCVNGQCVPGPECFGEASEVCIKEWGSRINRSKTHEHT